jgi:hypothetical protein
MIIPCMNSTSACERGGNVALVEDGRVLLGCPGAPGCTTTDPAVRSRCCACASGHKPAASVAPEMSMPSSATEAPLSRAPRLRHKSSNFNCGVQPHILAFYAITKNKSCVVPGPGTFRQGAFYWMRSAIVFRQPTHLSADDRTAQNPDGTRSLIDLVLSCIEAPAAELAELCYWVGRFFSCI